MNFKGPAKRIDDVDIPRIAATIGTGEDELRAVMEVEAGKSGFDSQGRPKMLFEGHVFYRLLSGVARDLAVKRGLAYPKWRRDYPNDSYPRLIEAMKIDRSKALKACSWGRGQIMGENHIAAGYQTVEEMVEDFTLDEDNHIEAMVRFIKANHLDDELRTHNWAAFARGYNGPGYKANAYDTKLAAAYAKWLRVADALDGIPPPPDVEPVVARKKSSTPGAKTSGAIAVGGAAAVAAAHGVDPTWIIGGVLLAAAIAAGVFFARKK